MVARTPPVTRDRVREDLRRIFDEVSSGPGGVGTGPMPVLKYSPEMARRAVPLINKGAGEILPPSLSGHYTLSSGLQDLMHCDLWQKRKQSFQSGLNIQGILRFQGQQNLIMGIVQVGVRPQHQLGKLLH